jgi:hypothetical protein
MAASLADVIKIFRHAESTNTPVFSSSSIRFADEVQTIARKSPVGELLGCESTGPLHIEKHHPDLFWYGVHGVEALYTVMGRGCQQVTRVDTEKSSVVVGKWSGGRIGSFRGLKVGAPTYGVTIYGMNGVAQEAGFSGYVPLVNVICEFFKTGEPPVASEETIELFAFMEAADESKRRGGEPVAISDVITKAEKEAAEQ